MAFSVTSPERREPNCFGYVDVGDILLGEDCGRCDVRHIGIKASEAGAARLKPGTVQQALFSAEGEHGVGAGGAQGGDDSGGQ